jgi:hypothetical protein
MANPLEELSIFHISTPKDKKTGERRAFGWITVKYSRHGTALAYYNYVERAIARATGGGYDKTHTALAGAIEKLAGVQLTVDGGAGFEAVQSSAGLQGVLVVPLRQLGGKY